MEHLCHSTMMDACRLSVLAILYPTGSNTILSKLFMHFNMVQPSQDDAGQSEYSSRWYRPETHRHDAADIPGEIQAGDVEAQAQGLAYGWL